LYYSKYGSWDNLSGWKPSHGKNVGVFESSSIICSWFNMFWTNVFSEFFFTIFKCFKLMQIKSLFNCHFRNHYFHLHLQVILNFANLDLSQHLQLHIKAFYKFFVMLSWLCYFEHNQTNIFFLILVFLI